MADKAPVPILAMGCASAACDFKVLKLQRRPPGPDDVVFDMKYCGLCHSDGARFPVRLSLPPPQHSLHIARGALEGVAGAVKYPIVPGHELAGVCTAVGANVTKFKVGDHVGVGCMVDSCMNCGACKRGEEQKCAKQVATYNGTDQHGRAASSPVGSQTLGGYSTKMVVHEKFAILLPPAYPLEFAGPVMCAGVTLFDPLRRYGAGKGSKVGVVGLGGLGQMGVRIAKAMGAEVTAISRGEAKRALATSCGADHYLASGDGAAMRAAADSLDLVLDTIPPDHDYMVYARLCKRAGGKLIILGLNSALGAAMMVDGLTCGASRVKMSGIGSIEATQAVVDLCAKHDIKPEIKIISAWDINGVYEELELGNDSGLRHVLDISTITEEAAARCTAPPPDFSKAEAKGMNLGGILGEAASMLFCGKWL